MGIPSAIFQVAAIFGRRLLPPNLAVSFFSKKPMPLPQKKLIPTIFLLLVIAAIAAPPLWWSSGNPPIIVANAPQNNRGPANIGQAKHIAKSAIAALRPILPAVATQIEADLAPIVDFTVPNPKTPEWIAKQKAPLLLGQLKAMADPFYRRLNTAAPTWLTAERTANGTNFPNSIFPWTSETTDDKNKSIANIGQLKAVFSLRFEIYSDTELDSDGDSLPDSWEIAYGLNPLDPGNVNSNNGSIGDPDQDGIANGTEATRGLNPIYKDNPKLLLQVIME